MGVTVHTNKRAQIAIGTSSAHHSMALTWEGLKRTFQGYSDDHQVIKLDRDTF